MMTSGKQISLPSLTFKMKIANFIEEKFPTQQRKKNECPHENNTKGPEVWVNIMQATLGSEFWACDIINV